MKLSHLVTSAAALAALACAPPVGAVPTNRSRAPEPWPLWEAYVRHYVSHDGRVIDHTGGGHSTSEGQAYGMFHALVAGDRLLFERLLTWAEQNLAGDDLRTRLPGWKWGRDGEGEWRLLDPNPASDADLWMVYTLLEASRLWCEPSYAVLADRMAELVVRTEVADLPGLGKMLLPAPEGFVLDERTWRLNPSYLPLFLLRRLSTAWPKGPWAELARTSVRLLRETAENGFVPDWVAYRDGEGFVPDPVAGPAGSYDAIRTYLWAGLLSDEDPDKATIAVALDGMYRHWRATGRVPERVAGGEARETGGGAPPGFYAALLPTAQQMGGQRERSRLEATLAAWARDGLYGSPPAYYDQNLVLFAEGHTKGRYRFGADGRLEPKWARARRCVH